MTAPHGAVAKAAVARRRSSPLPTGEGEGVRGFEILNFGI
jgi:hypothetical protein